MNKVLDKSIMFSGLSGNYLEAAKQKALATSAMARERATQNLGTLRNTAALGLTSAKSFAGQQLSKLAPAVDNTLDSLKATVLTLVGNIRDSKTLQSFQAKWNELHAAVSGQLGNEIQAANVPYPTAGRKRTRRHKRKGRK